MIKITEIIIFEFRESNLKKKEVTFLGQTIENFESDREFKKIEPKLPLHDNLDSDKILLFVDSNRDKMWMWCGEKITSRMKSAARELVPSIRNKYGIGSKRIPNYDNATPRMKFITTELITSVIDEGKEPFEFKAMLGQIEL